MTWAAPGYKQPPGWSKTRARILERDEHQCYLCSNAADQVDHVVPVHKGGTHDDANLAAICVPCHKAKTQREAAQARPRRKRPSEPHPNRRR